MYRTHLYPRALWFSFFFFFSQGIKGKERKYQWAAWPMKVIFSQPLISLHLEGPLSITWSDGSWEDEWSSPHIYNIYPNTSACTAWLHPIWKLHWPFFFPACEQHFVSEHIFTELIRWLMMMMMNCNPVQACPLRMYFAFFLTYDNNVMHFVTEHIFAELIRHFLPSLIFHSNEK